MTYSRLFDLGTLTADSNISNRSYELSSYVDLEDASEVWVAGTVTVTAGSSYTLSPELSTTFGGRTSRAYIRYTPNPKSTTVGDLSVVGNVRGLTDVLLRLNVPAGTTLSLELVAIVTYD